jgi:hypothetical protein
MTNIPDLLIPAWPHGTHAWIGFVLILVMALFKLDRGMLMYRRATYVDPFGASIITFDLVFAATFFFVDLEALYPGLKTTRGVFWVTLVPLSLAMLWQWAEIRLVEHERIVVSMGGPETDGWQPGDPDRRNGLPGRRITDGGTS